MGNRKEGAAKPATTPGPRHTRAGMSGVQIANDAGVCVARTPCLDRQAVADGALLAAAPDLLEALRGLVKAGRETMYDHHLLSALRDPLEVATAAIAKAEGLFVKDKALRPGITHWYVYRKLPDGHLTFLGKRGSPEGLRAYVAKLTSFH